MNPEYSATREGVTAVTGSTPPPRTAANPRSESVADLLKDLRDEGTNLVRQEVALAKTEMSEKASLLGRNAAYLMVGAFIALLGLIFVVQAITAGLGVILVAMGLDEEQALWLAPLIVGLIIAAIGAALISKSIKTIKNEPLAPTKTVDSLKEDRQWIQSKAH